MMTYLKRRFSSSDLQEDDPTGNMQNSLMNFLGMNNAQQPGFPPGSGPGPNQNMNNFNRPPPNSAYYANPPSSLQNAAGNSQVFGQAPKRTTYTSAPASPTKTTSGLSFNTISSQISNTIKSSLFAATQQPYGKCKVLLIIDDPNTDWSKYFRGRKILNDYEIRVEQALFSELSIASFSEQGAIAEITQIRDGQHVSRSFKPDYVLVRQHVRDGADNWKDLIIALHYGGVPGMNNLLAVYNFQDKPWVFAHLASIQQKLGHDQFPLIDQAFYPCFKDMERTAKRRQSTLAEADVTLKVMMAPRFPLVVKVAHAHGGVGKMRVESQADLQELSGLVGLAKTYATTEQFVDAKYDIRVQKIGVNYKAFIRKSISGSWKANIGANVLEKVPMNERFKMWIDECALVFGGLDICAIEMVQGKDGQPHIIDLSGSSMPLLGETQEEDRRLIADLVYAKMVQYFNKSAATSTVTKTASLHQVHAEYMQQAQVQPQSQPPPPPPQQQQPMASARAVSGPPERTAVPNGQMSHGASVHSGMAAQPGGPYSAVGSSAPMPQKQLPPQPSSASGGPFGPSSQPFMSGSGFGAPSMPPPRGNSVPPATGPPPGSAPAYGAPRPTPSIPPSGSGASLSGNLPPQPARPGLPPSNSSETPRSAYGPGPSGPSPANSTATSQTLPATQNAPIVSRFGPPVRDASGPTPTPPSRPPFTQSQSVTQSSVNPFGPPSQAQQRPLPPNAPNYSMPPSASAAQNAYGAPPTKQEEEDTMKNLRKTFAGIFGDI